MKLLTEVKATGVLVCVGRSSEVKSRVCAVVRAGLVPKLEHGTSLLFRGSVVALHAKRTTSLLGGGRLASGEWVDIGSWLV